MKQKRRSMTDVEAVIMSAAARIKIRNIKELAVEAGLPVSTLHDKMSHPEKIRLSDLHAMDRRCHFTPEESQLLIRKCISCSR